MNEMASSILGPPPASVAFFAAGLARRIVNNSKSEPGIGVKKASLWRSVAKVPRNMNP